MRGAYIHDLKAGARQAVDVSAPALTTAETAVQEAAFACGPVTSHPPPGPRAGGVR